LGWGQVESAEPKLGEFSWHELATTDWKAAWTFYETVFGWEKRAEHDMGPMGVYMLLGIGGRPRGSITCWSTAAIASRISSKRTAGP
jgi:predicted enzyme related to lactoylglutathione lyase